MYLGGASGAIQAVTVAVLPISIREFGIIGITLVQFGPCND